MRLTIVAATGGVGRHILEQAIAAGHDVTAVARNPRRVPAAARVVQADVTSDDLTALVSAFEGADAVLSGLGPRSKAEVGIAEKGTRALVRAMERADVRRIAVVSAAPVSTTPSPGRPTPPKKDPGDGFFTRNVLTPLVKAALRGNYADLARMEDALRDSATDWTAVRPPRLINKPLTGTYRTTVSRNVPRGRSISRADLADLMLNVLGMPETIKQVVGVAY